MQMACQGRWLSDSDLLSMPHLEHEHLSRLFNNPKQRIDCVPRLIQVCEENGCKNVIESLLDDLLDRKQIKDLYDVVKILPIIDVKFHINHENNSFVINVAESERKVYELYENEEYVFDIELTKRCLDMSQANRSKKAHAPKYPKDKDENWVVLLGINCDWPSQSELLALKRVNSIKSSRQTTHLLFRTPEISQSTNNDLVLLTVFLMSDVYLGMDQQFDFKFRLKKKDFLTEKSC